MATPAEARWRARPWLAFGLRTISVLVPVAAATGVGLTLGHLVARPGDTVGLILWALLVLGGAFLAGVLVARAARRFAPLAIMVRLSLVFPDRAPSRFRLAMRASSLGRLRAALERAEASEEPLTAQQQAEMILSLATALGAHDRRTRGHCERVRALTDLMSDQLGLDEETADRLRWGALLHDIGKLSVPAAILNKPAKLDDRELRIMRRHPSEGVRIAEPLAWWLGEAGDAIGQHHERFDGSGYPHGIAGDDISLAGRVVALTDAYDTMTSVRAYKTAMSMSAAREEVAACAGSHFDPAIARTFVDISLPRLWMAVGPAALLAQIPFVAVALRGAADVPALLGASAGALGAATVLVAGTQVAPAPPITDAQPVSAPATSTASPAASAAAIPVPGPASATAAPPAVTPPSAAPAPTPGVVPAPGPVTFPDPAPIVTDVGRAASSLTEPITRDLPHVDPTVPRLP